MNEECDAEIKPPLTPIFLKHWSKEGGLESNSFQPRNGIREIGGWYSIPRLSQADCEVVGLGNGIGSGWVPHHLDFTSLSILFISLTDNAQMRFPIVILLLFHPFLCFHLSFSFSPPLFHLRESSISILPIFSSPHMFHIVHYSHWFAGCCFRSLVATPH